jgi:hypothetical protein
MLIHTHREAGRSRRFAHTPKLTKLNAPSSHASQHTSSLTTKNKQKPSSHALPQPTHPTARAPIPPDRPAPALATTSSWRKYLLSWHVRPQTLTRNSLFFGPRSTAWSREPPPPPPPWTASPEMLPRLHLMLPEPSILYRQRNTSFECNYTHTYDTNECESVRVIVCVCMHVCTYCVYSI